MVRKGIVAWVALAASAFGATAHAQGLPRQWRWCGSDDSRRSMDACSAIIDSGRRTQNDRSLAEAYANRGGIYADQGETQKAIADYTQAIRLNPRRDDVFMSRGILYYESGDYRHALADFDAAIRLNPGEAVNWAWRSHAKGHLGDADGANADMAHALALDPQVEDNVPSD